MKLTEAFQAVYRRGRWAHGPALSVGARDNRTRVARVGLRTKKGLKGAVERNRLKRQLRTAVFGRPLALRPGVDLVVVMHPKQLPARTDALERELIELCRRLSVLRLPA